MIRAPPTSAIANGVAIHGILLRIVPPSLLPLWASALTDSEDPECLFLINTGRCAARYLILLIYNIYIIIENDRFKYRYTCPAFVS